MTEQDAVRRLRQIATETFGWHEFRPGQLRAMSAVVAGQDTLAVMPTGSGKSAIYQVPAMLLDGPAVVVSPLISLQHDQVVSLLDRGIVARELNSTLGATERETVYRELADRDVQFVFLAPEQLARDDVRERLAAAKPALLVVDEVHCVSSWGHDFRPDYLRLGDLVDQLGRPVVLGLTATASRPVRSEVVERLRLRDPLVVVSGFDRPNLSLAAVPATDADGRLAAVVERAAGIAGTGIVYTTTRRETEQYAAALGERERDGRRLRAAPYHAGLPKAERARVHEDFLVGRLDVVVATTAFGMGIDKPDVRYVLHAGVADSLDSYYQEIGRAGRDGEPAEAVLFHGQADLGLRRFLSAAPPDEQAVAQVLAAIQAAGTPPLRRDLAQQTGLAVQLVGRCCSLLEQVGAVRFDRRNRLHPSSSDEADLVSQAMRLAETRQQVERSRLDMMRDYAETTGCRRQFLLSYFGEELPEPCGNCDTCHNGSAEQHARDSRESPYPLDSRVRHTEFGVGQVLQFDGDRIVVRFDEVGYRTLSLSAVEENALLEQL
ncbi:ATP-dependent DNA helicase, RecQ family [Kribbella flavida DSM 17836]|uniref:ATP-dependent DNA helicase RecQ n=1 Tax=Kribbella flavida (strain DSM 17836 / JCM 10339 / NBRC 14399) TaxID=479435 RepID=D2PPU4_KRIFD|nr:ATP-dependent DNA helicase RecQ [Kribbella flavida]ADB32868.1 ATP-dependent DNA helicase, RecQ family [Kribbella flavida DSM 17836]